MAKKGSGKERNGVPNKKKGTIYGPRIEPVPVGGVDGPVTHPKGKSK